MTKEELIEAIAHALIVGEEPDSADYLAAAIDARAALAAIDEAGYVIMPKEETGTNTETTRLVGLLIANGIDPRSSHICKCGLRRDGEHGAIDW